MHEPTRRFLRINSLFSDKQKIIVYTSIFTLISTWIFAGPLLSGKSFFLKYGVAFGGTLTGVWLANAIYKRWDRNTNKGRSSISMIAALSGFICVILILWSQIYFRGRNFYAPWEITAYFLGLFVLTCLASSLTFYGGKARNLI